MLKILKDIIAETGYRPGAIRKILSGQARKSSSKRLRLAIYRITGRLLPLPQIAKGPYSNSPIIRGLAEFVTPSDTGKFLYNVQMPDVVAVSKSADKDICYTL